MLISTCAAALEVQKLSMFQSLKGINVDFHAVRVRAAVRVDEPEFQSLKGINVDFHENFEIAH